MWQTGKPRSDRGSKAVEIECSFCGKPFRAGGRDANGDRLPNKNVEYCSRLCALRSRNIDGQTCRAIPEEFKEWLAAYFDGEGSAFFVVQGDRRRPYVQVTVGSTDQGTIREIMQVTGVGSLLPRPSKNPRHRDLVMWRCFAKAAIGVLQEIYPKLTIKSAVADFIFASAKQMRDDPKLAYDPAFRSALEQTGKLLNARGPEGPKARKERRSPYVERRWQNAIAARPYSPLMILGVERLLGDNRDDRETATGHRFCPVCGTEFKARTNPTKKNPGTTCSRRCALVYRRRRGVPCLRLKPELAKRIAGYFDAEGWIAIKRSVRTAHAAIHFGNTDELVVRLIRNSVGSGCISYRAPKKATHAESWHWRCQADAAHGLLEQVYPYLRTKRRAAKLALYVQERLAIPRSRVDRHWQDEAVAASHLLNSKGRVNIPPRISLAGGKFSV